METRKIPETDLEVKCGLEYAQIRQRSLLLKADKMTSADVSWFSLLSNLGFESPYSPPIPR